jgi:hypothetical protein
MDLVTGVPSRTAPVGGGPLYKRFAARLPWRLRRRAAALIFTSMMTVFVLAPLLVAFLALLTEVNELLLNVAAADAKGIRIPHLLESIPLAGAWVADRWQSELAHPGTLSLWAQRIDSTALFRWAQLLRIFMGRHVFIIGFTILALFFLRRGLTSARFGMRTVSTPSFRLASVFSLSTSSLSTKLGRYSVERMSA